MQATKVTAQRWVNLQDAVSFGAHAGGSPRMKAREHIIREMALLLLP